VKRLLIAVLAVVAVLATTVTASWAHPRRVPFGSFGVTLDTAVPDDPHVDLDAQMAMMARSGVESVRTNFYWSAANPAPGVYDWTLTDQIVQAAANHGLQVLPVVEFTPQWASSSPLHAWLYYAPSSYSTWTTFLTRLVGRYGPNGTFWRNNPHYDPITAWQIWDEPEGTKYDWRSQPWPKTYTTLLKTAYQTIHRLDHRALVVCGGFVGLNGKNLTPWAEARALYAAGAKRYFDVVAVHSFTLSGSVSNTVDRAIEVVALVRQVMQAYHDGRKPVWVTELTWSAALGRVPPSDYAGFETTARGQQQRLSLYFRRVAATRPQGIQRTYWYTWASEYSPQSFGGPVTFQYTGLERWIPGQATFTPLPLLRVYANVAAIFEGCRKSSNARVCG
jgi:hypothetical protein